MHHQAQIGKFIANIREQKGLTQADLAKELKTSQSAIARIEAGRQNLSSGLISKISKILGRSIINLPDSLNFRIEGGRELHGEVATNSSKNGAVALLMASLLNSGKTVLRRVPKIEEVSRIIEVLKSLGVSFRWIGDRDLEITPPSVIDIDSINKESALKTRSVLLLLGPLIHLLDKFHLPQSGGCKLGERTVRPHLYALEKLGVEIETLEDAYKVSVNKLKPAEIVLYESGDTATENIIMAASRINGTTIINLASANYMVQDLCYFLNGLGVEIGGIGTHILTIKGKKDINRNIEYSITEDPIDSMLFISAAATTNSSIEIKGCPIDFLGLELLKLEKMGLRYKILRRYKAHNGFTNLIDIKIFKYKKLNALEEKIYSRPFPGLNIDNLPFFVPIAARAHGQTFIHDWVYENRAIYYTELSKLGAQINLVDSHRVYVNGPTEFKSTEIISPPALRPAAIILIGMLAATGTSILRNVYTINRGYEEIHNKLNNLGAKIEMF